MALYGVPSASMKPTALVLNIVVASLGSIRYLRAGLFRWRVLWPFLLGALPFAFVVTYEPELVTKNKRIGVWGKFLFASLQGFEKQRIL